ncbi:hypothetical protein [Kitasatospora sp. Ki12]
MVPVTFTALYEWAVVPEQSKIDRKAAREERDLYDRSFRYKRISRLPADCPPWVMGQELGWLVRSPISFAPEPLEDREFTVPDDEEVAAAARKLSAGELWRRDEAWISTRNASWMREFDFRGDQGWEGMFVPNGSGTVEWRLGWGIQIPERYFLLVTGAGCGALDIPLGVLPAQVVNKMAGRGGFSLAAGIRAGAPIRRGDPIARLILLHQDSLQARTERSTDSRGH